MSFAHILNNYIELIGCSAKDLAHASNLSEPTISRYCNNSRTPLNNSEQLNKLINGLITLANKNNIELDKKVIQEEFDKVLSNYDMNMVITNFNHLVNILKINMADFSRTLGFDASYISKIRSGKRKPSDPKMFVDAICNYIANNYNSDDDKILIFSLVNESTGDIKQALTTFLCEGNINQDDNIDNFLTKLNDFNLNEYIKVIHFDEIKIPTIPFKIPKSKHYYGLEEMKQGELDFLKSTVLAKSKGEVFMCSDMQMDDMASDLEFGKKWMFGIAMMIKKGVHLNVIHNLDRPFKEMMLGLESWIPIYMTGQVSPYYLTNVENSTYSHLNFVSQEVALTGECIKGYHAKGKYYLTNNKNEVNYFKEKSKFLLKKAHPLMNIYRDDTNILNAFLDKYSKVDGKRKKISSSLPIYTISTDLLLKILKRNNVSTEDTKKIIKFVEKIQLRMKSILNINKIEEVISKIDKDEFDKYPVYLELSEMFYPNKITYTYDEYIEHCNNTKKYSTSNKNYHLTFKHNYAFRNIKIYIHENKWVMISKLDNPAVHFVIEHPKLREAIENFVAPIVE